MTLRDLMRTIGPGRRDGRNLTRDEAYEGFSDILSGKEGEIAAAAFLVAMRSKGTTMEELMGFACAARDRANIPCSEVDGLVCLCPDHDGRDSRPPLETAAGLVAAGAGARVMIITERSVPPKRGLTAASVLEELGAGLTWDPSEVEDWVVKTGFGAIALSGILPGILSLRRVRGEVGTRTPLSTVEKLFSPASASVVVGAREGPVLGVAVEVLQGLGHPRAVAIQGVDGSIIPSVGRRTRGIELAGSHLMPLTVEPGDFGLMCDSEVDLPMYGPPDEGKGTADNAELRRACAAITEMVLAGEPGPARSATLLGAAVILKTCGRALTLAEGVDAAISALDAGRPREILDRLRDRV